MRPTVANLAGHGGWVVTEHMEIGDVPVVHHPRLTALATAFPERTYQQSTIAAYAHDYMRLTSQHFTEQFAADLHQLFISSGVRERQIVLDFVRFYGDLSTGQRPVPPSTGERMAAYAPLAYQLGRRALESALLAATPVLAPTAITDLAIVSCTGYVAPGLDIQLARDLGMARDIRRTVIGHMGCYGALVGLRHALASVHGYANATALVLCVELTSLHFQPSDDFEVLTSFALFGDAAAAFILTTREEATGPAVVDVYCATDFSTSEQMSWSVTDTGFMMGLSPRVPASLRRAIRPVIDRLLTPHGLALTDVRHWIIHPGGPAILKAIQQRLELTDADMAPAYTVLREHGNCSSSTVLAVLDEVQRTRQPRPGEWGVMMAFGPGLTLETALLRF